MKIKAKIYINNKNTDGYYSKLYLLGLYKLGAEITAYADRTLFLENEIDMQHFMDYFATKAIEQIKNRMA